MGAGPRDSLPAKITSSIALPRRCLALCSPMTHRMASTMLDLPHPFGPTTAVMGSGKVKIVRSTNDLNPQISSRLIRISAAPRGVTIHDHYGHTVVAPGGRGCKAGIPQALGHHHPSDARSKKARPHGFPF